MKTEPKEVAHSPNDSCIVSGPSQILRQLAPKISKIGAQDIPVLLTGPPGVGKHAFAQAIHQASQRAGAPFVCVDCRALSDEHFEQQLFGREHLTPSGRVSFHLGALERAKEGTLYLAALSALPARAQTALLQVLRRGSFRRQGSNEEQTLDLRILAGASPEKESLVAADVVLPELYYRLSAVSLKIPTLKERKQDLPNLIEHFTTVTTASKEVTPKMLRQHLTLLLEYDWPENLPELRNAIDSLLASEGLPEHIRKHGASLANRKPPSTEAIEMPPGLIYKKVRGTVVQDFEHRFLQRLLVEFGGNVSRAARGSQMARSHLTLLLRRHNLI